MRFSESLRPEGWRRQAKEVRPVLPFNTLPDDESQIGFVGNSAESTYPRARRTGFLSRFWRGRKA